MNTIIFTDVTSCSFTDSTSVSEESSAFIFRMEEVVLNFHPDKHSSRFLTSHLRRQ
jgi:hypothetical protein